MEMKRLTAVAAILLASGASLAVPTAGATALFQRGQNEARTLVGHVLDDREQPLQKAIVYLKNTKSLSIKTYQRTGWHIPFFRAFFQHRLRGLCGA
jgi:hypothetical protein